MNTPKYTLSDVRSRRSKRRGKTLPIDPRV
jgi:hypothetical protein